MSLPFTHIAILTGAGISAESGIPVFRSEDGLWEQHRVEDVATYEGFMRDKTLVHNFYNTMRRSLKERVPNAGHLAITKLQSEMEKRGGSVTIITQNIDDLHEKAQSHNIIHMHGELNSILCEHCGSRFTFHEDSSVASVCPKCKHQALRPDIVWFGEIPYHMDEIEKTLFKCDLFIAVGTSGVVYPAAGFVGLCRQLHKTCIEFNLEPSAVNSSFTYSYYGKAGTTLPLFVDYLLEHNSLPTPQDLEAI